MNLVKTVDRYLSGQRLSKKSKYCYASILRRFVNHANSCGATKLLTLRHIRSWLCEDSKSHPATFEHRMITISSFLKWCASQGLAADPLAMLRDQHNVGSSTLARALLKPNYAAILEGLRPPPKWASDLAPLMLERIGRMKNLGHRYDTAERQLLQFDRFLQQRPELRKRPLAELVRAWAESGTTLAHRLRAQNAGRTVSKEMLRHDPRTSEVVVEKGLARRVKNAQRRPTLFTEAEVRRLVEVAEQPTQLRFALMHRVAHAAVVLLTCTGMRVGELVSFRLGDVDEQAGTLLVRESKFYKTRVLPMRSTVLQVLRRYLEFRGAVGAPLATDSPLWWSEAKRSGYRYSGMRQLVAGAMHRAGLRGRIHDLRHTFVAHRMAAWYREGVDVETKLPHLATYLGHKDIASTLVYLTINPEVLQHASDRYQRLMFPVASQESAS